jgi:hypothetical protein
LRKRSKISEPRGKPAERAGLPAITATIAVLNAATLESVGLDHKHRPPISRLGEDLSPLKLAYLYQESFSTDLSWARSNAGSTVAGLREYTSFRRSVTAFPCCRFRNSEIAVAYN